MSDRPVVTVEVAALLLDVDVEAVHRLVGDGKLESVEASDGSVDVCMASVDALRDD